MVIQSRKYHPDIDPTVSIADLESSVVSSAEYALCGSASITAECRRDAAVLLLVWARTTGKATFDREEMEVKEEEAYQYFEYGGDDYPPPIWAVWDLPDEDD